MSQCASLAFSKIIVDKRALNRSSGEAQLGLRECSKFNRT
jgi:hypothetical protein